MGCRIRHDCLSRGRRHRSDRRLHLFSVLMTTPSKYFAAFVATVIVAATLIGIFNYIVDPYYIYGAARIPYLNIEKPRFGNRRIFLPVYIARQRSDVIVLGSSRGTAIAKAFAATWPND